MRHIITPTARQQRGLWVIFSLVFLLLMCAVFKQLEESTKLQVLRHPFRDILSKGRPPNTTEPAQNSTTSPDGTSFKDVALKHGTDKVTAHKYHFMYDKYLKPLQAKPVKLLEIGLGCNMAYGPGASYYTWLEFLPGVELYFIENDVECAEKYKKETADARIAIGDQADIKFLQRFSTEATNGSLFDVIIDDGGHFMKQQITSLEQLWKVIKPGGVYVIEDLQTSYWENYHGDPSARDTRKHTTMKYLYGVLDDLMAGWTKKPISRELEAVECMAEICALRKKMA
ncbi:hypothetical protein ACJ41O_013808 [Fusarium nematophilum]